MPQFINTSSATIQHCRMWETARGMMAYESTQTLKAAH